VSDSARPPVAAQARRNALEKALVQLARTMEQLETAVGAFSPDFDLTRFTAAWFSVVPEERNRAMLVRSNMDDLHNLCRGLIGLSVRVAQDVGAMPVDRTTPMTDQLRAQGLYPGEAERVMQEVVDLRNASQHEYWTLMPDDVHGAVQRQRQYLPSFIANVGVWMEGLPSTQGPG
jgi:uncharacterized protein YutE (UPF0331/DUF86 family)